jgi:hypothetical protein
VPKRLAGAVPPLARLGSTSARVSWGVELGARYRDAMRAAADAGAQLDAWQLDEIEPSAGTASGGPIRELTRGVLRGLVFGRPALGDASMRGFVWVAHSALGIASLPITAELTTSGGRSTGRLSRMSARSTRRSRTTRVPPPTRGRQDSERSQGVDRCAARLPAAACPG